MSGALVLTRNELRRLFAQPLAWTLLAAVLGVLAYFFLLSLEAFLVLTPKLAGVSTSPGVGDLVALPLLRATASLLLLVVPLLGMRAIAGELKNPFRAAKAAAAHRVPERAIALRHAQQKPVCTSPARRRSAGIIEDIAPRRRQLAPVFYLPTHVAAPLRL